MLTPGWLYQQFQGCQTPLVPGVLPEHFCSVLLGHVSHPWRGPVAGMPDRCFSLSVCATSAWKASTLLQTEPEKDAVRKPHPPFIPTQTLDTRTSTPDSTLTYSSLRLPLLWSFHNETELWSCWTTLESPCESPLAADGSPANIPVALALMGHDLFLEPWHHSSVIFLFLYVFPSAYLRSPLPYDSFIVDNLGNKTQNGLAATCCSLLQVSPRKCNFRNYLMLLNLSLY